MRNVVVVGGGVSGLAAASALAAATQQRDSQIQVTVLERSDRVGGKLRTGSVVGLSVDDGAEAMLVTRPEGVDLLRAVGLGPELVSPRTSAASVLSRGTLRAFPTGTVLGVPGDLRALAGSRVLSTSGLARVVAERAMPAAPPRSDVTVGGYVGRRLGWEAVDRLVEPLLGGVYAGRAARLSFAATMPGLYAEVRRTGRVLESATKLRIGSSRGGSASGTAFAGVRGGLGRLPAAIVSATPGLRVETGVTVRALERTTNGWRVVTGPVSAPSVYEADAVVLAVPAPSAARLLRGLLPRAADDLEVVRYASMALVWLAYPSVSMPGRVAGRRADRLAGSGHLVPPVERDEVKAVTYATSKWDWVAAAEPGRVLFRVSIGRDGEEALLQRADADLIRLGAHHLEDRVGVHGAPLDGRVVRWGGALPQYEVGHLDRAARVHRALSQQPGLAMCGAALDGVGIPACIASGNRAAARVLEHVAPVGRPVGAHIGTGAESSP